MPGKLIKILVPMLAATLLLAVACGSEEPAAQTAEQPAAQAAAQPAAQPAAQAAAQPAAQPAAQAAAQPAAQPATGASAAVQPAAAAQPQTTAPAGQPEASAEKIRVVTTSNIIADWVRAVGQDRLDVFSLLPANADPHTYQPGAQDIAKVADADLVMSVGLSLEAGWLTDLVENAAQDPHAIVEVGEGVDPIDFVEIFEDHHDEEEMTALLGKLVIGDGQTGAMSFIELDHGEVEQDAYDMGSRAGRIYATRSGRFAIAVSSDANMVHIIDGGTYLEAHGDHFDLVNGEAEPLGLDLSGDRPVHMFVGDEWATIYYDGSGDVVFINEHELEEEGAAYEPIRFNVGPQHGAAVPLEGDLFAVTPQHPNYDSNPEQYRLPVGADIWDVSGNVLYSAEGCPDLHGDASNGHIAVFGCTGGVLAVSAEEGEYDHTFIGAPEGSPDNFRLTSVWGTSGADHFFALGSAVGLYVVEPEEGEMEQLIAAEEGNSPIQVALSRDGEQLVVVMSSGEIRLYDTHDGDVIATNSEALTTPLETGFWGRPHIAMAPGAIFVTDSVGGQVLQLDDHDLEEVDHWDVAGNPTKVAFVGIQGETEGHEEEGHGHEEEGDGHDHGELDPHFWFDPIRVKQAVNSIAAHLSGVDPEGQTFYRDNAAAYSQELDELHAWIEDEVSELDEDHRLLVTSHDSFQYFAQRYGFEVVGAIMPVTTEVEPTAMELAELVETIEHSGAHAVFAEKTQTDRLARQIADETGAQLIGGLYTGSLGPEGGEAGTYLEFMRYNVSTIVEALH
ncbi:MAG: metal ABC transporter substrate-binding protein [Chloroflexota bacterium]|nr:metal ABC transporter substrate-binding protein [Chloroflexota bacterium]